ncbi:nucleotide-binding domain-containing protein [Culicoidibacter larvae]|uniref:Nucleotidyltransferase n=1 Tax=Culicoidibacter larvae TaxID=2579976 RepID=A0A5R8QH44_9FIRM|nr:nucleotidyltransferase domain-containing protein [Culicoidibacter larvae]TLG77361.1 nucleotidyltransferase [Culicoidibacter larvae]
MIINYAKTLQRSKEESEKWQARITRINNKLCDEYYPERENHTIIVGSVGRGTAVSNTSDYDVIFKLPYSVFKKFDSYESNGQSQLLQEIRNIIMDLHPKTDIKGDGQVVSIEYKDGVIELVPGFEQTDGSYKYPDSKDGGSWKITKPIPEIEESNKQSKNSTQYFNYLCYLIRQWKNYMGFSFKGLLIDTLIAKYLDEETYANKTELKLLEDCFVFFSKENKEQAFWYALGSNQKIYNRDEGLFVTKAKKIVKKFEDCTEEEILKEVFGYKQSESKSANEEFIEDKFIVDIQYNLIIDCDVFQDGFRGMKLSKYINSKFRLGRGKTLNFSVVSTNIPTNLSIKYFWKVRNVGREAVGKERGQIFLGEFSLTEHTNFNGNHYVECYAVHEDIVIARSKIKVPIDVVKGI